MSNVRQTCIHSHSHTACVSPLFCVTTTCLAFTVSHAYLADRDKRHLCTKHSLQATQYNSQSLPLLQVCCGQSHLNSTCLNALQATINYHLYAPFRTSRPINRPQILQSNTTHNNSHNTIHIDRVHNSIFNANSECVSKPKFKAECWRRQGGVPCANILIPL